MIKYLFYIRFFLFDEFDIFYFKVNEKAFNILSDIKLFKFYIKSLFFNFFYIFEFFIFKRFIYINYFIYRTFNYKFYIKFIFIFDKFKFD